MAETVTMPKLGFDMAEGTLVRWVKTEGDSVAKGEVLAEIETDKATVEVESSFSGVVRKHLVEQGAVVPVGTPIAIIAAPDEVIDEAQAVNPVEAPPAAPKEEVKTEVQPKEGVPTDGAQAGPTPPGSPPIQVKEPAPPPPSPEEAAAPEKQGEVRASPLARRVAREQGIQLDAVEGTGPGGRVVRRDIEAAKGLQAAPTQTQAGAPAPAPQARPETKPILAPVPAQWAEQAPILKDETIPVSKFRAAIGRRMAESKQLVPHFYVTHEYAVDDLMALRKQVNAALPEDQRISVNDFIIKAVALTLRQFPNVNSSLDGDQIQRHSHINIGVAVAVEGGLMTVVCRDADQKPLRVISQEVREMAGRAKSGRVKPQDIEGSTFSTSNLGMYDVDEFSAIINPPEAGILAIGSAKPAPYVKDGEVKAGIRMKATISIDHRVSDGAEGARFMQALAQYLENPLWLML